MSNYKEHFMCESVEEQNKVVAELLSNGYAAEEVESATWFSPGGKFNRAVFVRRVSK